MSARRKLAISSVLALVLSILVAVGAPPSEFVKEPSRWLRLEPLMFPLLGAGVAVAVLAMVLTPFVVRAAAVACIGAALLTSLGLFVAWGLDAEARLRGLVLPVAFVIIPALGALEALRQVKRDAGVPDNDEMQLTSGAAGRAPRALH